MGVGLRNWFSQVLQVVFDVHSRERTTVLDLEVTPGGGQTPAIQFGKAVREVPTENMYVHPDSLASYDFYPVESLD